MNTIIIDRKDLTERKDGLLIKEWERGDVTLYMHLAKLDGMYSDICTLQVTDLGNGEKEYNYANTSRPIVSSLDPIQFLNKYIIPYYHGTQII
jgi:hypothetical protein